uniref:Uncharacterized protein n=1 Tax=Oryza sativa subsp. japonica TaxID=39947 RepID=Q8LN83_ORYSJ|nr:hypothetical protein [Oryza sativa Japonica Group]
MTRKVAAMDAKEAEEVMRRNAKLEAAAAEAAAREARLRRELEAALARLAGFLNHRGQGYRAPAAVFNYGIGIHLLQAEDTESMPPKISFTSQVAIREHCVDGDVRRRYDDRPDVLHRGVLHDGR